jgi:hypothetical protein
MRRFLSLLLLSLLVAIPGLAEEADAPRVKEAWRPLPDVKGDTFRFLVMADNQPHGDPERIAVTKVFERIVDQANLLSPDFVLMPGDLILGYDRDRETIHRMWDAFDAAAAKLDCPYRIAPGNHCIWDAQSAAIWKERYGPTYHAFSLGGCRFLALNSEETYGVRDRLSPEQIAWLEKEIEAAKDAQHVFVYLHKPLWRFEPGRGPWMAEVHPILRRHPSVTVFAGHFHVFERSNDRDHVRYYIAPAAGGPIGRVEAAGELHGFLHVTVKGPKVVVACIREKGGVLPDSFLPEDRREALYQTGQSFAPAPAVFGDAPPGEVELPVSLKNHLGEALDVEVSVEVPEGCAWKVLTPTGNGRVEGGETGSVTVKLVVPAEPFPAPKVRLVGRSGETVLVDKDGSWPVKFARRLGVERAAAAPAIDGVPSEDAWKTAKPAGRFVTLQGDAYAKRDTSWRALWDDEHLYLAFELAEPAADALVTRSTERDWMMVNDDAVVFYVDVVRDGKSRFCFGVTAAGVPMEYAAPGGAVDVAWSGPWKQAARKTESGWSFEVAIPWTSLGVTPQKGKTFAVAAFRNANPGERELSGWTVPVRGLSNPAGFGEAVLK